MTWDFNENLRWKITEDKLIGTVEKDGKEISYRKIDGRDNRYEQVELNEVRSDVIGCIGRINVDESMTIVSMEERIGIKEDIKEVKQRFPVQN